MNPTTSGAYTKRLSDLANQTEALQPRLQAVLTNLRGAPPPASNPSAQPVTPATIAGYIQAIESGLELAFQLFTEIEALVG